MSNKDVEISMYAQFIDVLEVIAMYDNIEDVREDIVKRKEIYKGYIKELKEYEETEE